MISTPVYLIGFLIYIFFLMITFYYVSKISPNKKTLKLISIYIYYSALILYWLKTVDINGNSFEFIIQGLVYILISSGFIYFYYENIIKEALNNYFR